MLLRICLILAILAGAGTIFVTHKLAREAVQTAINDRDANIKGRAEEKKRAEKAEGTLASTRSTLATTSNTLVKTEEELTSTKQRLATTEEQLNKTKGELVKSSEEVKRLQGEIAKWESIGLKPEQIREMIANLKKAQDAIAALEDEKGILSRQVAVLTNRLRSLVEEDYEAPVPSGTKGNIVAVDPKWNFVILDIGEKQNLLTGGVLLVHRNSQLVGKVRISEVMPNRSVATVMPGWSFAGLEEGDQVISKN